MNNLIIHPNTLMGLGAPNAEQTAKQAQAAAASSSALMTAGMASPEPISKAILIAAGLVTGIIAKGKAKAAGIRAEAEAYNAESNLMIDHIEEINKALPVLKTAIEQVQVQILPIAPTLNKMGIATDVPQGLNGLGLGWPKFIDKAANWVGEQVTNVVDKVGDVANKATGGKLYQFQNWVNETADKTGDKISQLQNWAEEKKDGLERWTEATFTPTRPANRELNAAKADYEKIKAQYEPKVAALETAKKWMVDMDAGLRSIYGDDVIDRIAKGLGLPSLNTKQKKIALIAGIAITTFGLLMFLLPGDKKKKENLKGLPERKPLPAPERKKKKGKKTVSTFNL